MARCDNLLCTWWHHNGVINANTSLPVAANEVRMSSHYTVEVRRLGGGSQFRESFVYETVPRNGKGRAFSPWDPPFSNTLSDAEDDGVSDVEMQLGMCMAWSSFLYAADVEVKIRRRSQQAPINPAAIIIRPTSLAYAIEGTSDGGLLIQIPYEPNGRKFSVELNDDLFEYRSLGQTQRQYTSSGTLVGVEPKHSLLIFASPFLEEGHRPRMTTENTQTMSPGPINNGDWGAKPILYFPAGTYWLNQATDGTPDRLGQNRMILNGNTRWVHFEQGAFVKAAIHYKTGAQDFYATGHGVLSGEHYVYMANIDYDYQAIKDDGRSLRMWEHTNISAGQTWHCVGPTLVSPPFNTMDFWGSEDISVMISDYKQVGAFFFQTDGPQMYPHSYVHDVFYHVNDDGLKGYYSHVYVKNATIWKVKNDPVIQLGWGSRAVQNMTVDSLNVIHTRYPIADIYTPTAIVGSSPMYNPTRAPEFCKSIRDFTLAGLVCEGPCPGLFRLTPLVNYENFVVRGAAFPDGLVMGDVKVGESMVWRNNPGGLAVGPVPAWYNTGTGSIGDWAAALNHLGPRITMELDITGWTVRGVPVTMDNFQTGRLGQLDIDVSYWGQWTIRRATVPPAPLPPQTSAPLPSAPVSTRPPPSAPALMPPSQRPSLPPPRAVHPSPPFLLPVAPSPDPLTPSTAGSLALCGQSSQSSGTISTTDVAVTLIAVFMVGFAAGRCGTGLLSLLEPRSSRRRPFAQMMEDRRDARVSTMRCEAAPFPSAAKEVSISAAAAAPKAYHQEKLSDEQGLSSKEEGIPLPPIPASAVLESP
jgi:hypothetical protein